MRIKKSRLSNTTEYVLGTDADGTAGTERGTTPKSAMSSSESVLNVYTSRASTTSLGCLVGSPVLLCDVPSAREVLTV